MAISYSIKRTIKVEKHLLLVRFLSISDTTIIVLKKIFKTDFFKNIYKVGLGIIIAQIVGFIAYPILTRIYTPEEFGIYAIFSSAVLVGSLLVTGTYEFAMPLSKNINQAAALTKLCHILAIVSVSIIFLILIFIAPYIQDISNTILFIIPFGILLHAFINIRTQNYTYSKSFNDFSYSKISQTSAVVIVQIATGFLKFGIIGLVLGHIAGRIGFLSIKIKKYLALLNTKKTDLKNTAKVNSKHPIYVLPSSLVNAFSKELPIFLILPFFGDQVLGQYSLAFKVLITPVLLFSASIDSVFFQSIGQAINERKKVLPKIIKLWGILFCVGILPFTAILLWGESIFIFLFGDIWSISGEIASILSLMLFMRFIFLPTSKSMLALSQQKWMPIFSILSLAVTFSSLYLGFIFEDYFLAFLLLSAGETFLYISQMLFISYAAKTIERLPY